MDRKIFHIRAPLPRKVGNQFYRDTDVRVPKTLCGAPVSANDIRYGWQAGSIGVWDCCEDCVAIRRDAKIAHAR